MNNEVIKISQAVGGLLVVTGAALQFFEFDFAKYIFAVGVAILIGVQANYLSNVRNESIRIQRIVRMMFFVTLLLGLAVYLMFTGDERWVVLILIYALVSVFLTLRTPKGEK